MENINFYYLLLLMLAGTNIFHSSIFMCIFITMVSLCCITTTSVVVDFYIFMCVMGQSVVLKSVLVNTIAIKVQNYTLLTGLR